MSVIPEPEAAFLEESDALAGVSGPDYRDPLLAQEGGHAGAWLLLKERALAREPLTRDDVCTAAAWLGVSGDLPAVDEMAEAVAGPGPKRDFYGGYTIHLAARYLRRFMEIDGRLARLICAFVLLRRNWPLLFFRRDEGARLEAGREGDVAMGRLLIEKVRESATCGSCRSADVERVAHGIEIDTYRCGDCGVEFKLDWKGLMNAWRDASSSP